MRIKIKKQIDITFLDYPDNESMAFIIYFLGCDNNCACCHNPTFSDMNYNSDLVEYISLESLKEKLYKFKNKYDINKLVFSGGDPLYMWNVNFIRKLLNEIKSDFDIMVYTGHDIEYVKKKYINGFKYIKCNKYDINKKQESEKTDTYIKFASSNQELYDENFNLISEDGIYYY